MLTIDWLQYSRLLYHVEAGPLNRSKDHYLFISPSFIISFSTFFILCFPFSVFQSLRNAVTKCHFLPFHVLCALFSVLCEQLSLGHNPIQFIIPNDSFEVTAFSHSGMGWSQQIYKGDAKYSCCCWQGSNRYYFPVPSFLLSFPFPSSSSPMVPLDSYELGKICNRRRWRTNS